MIHSGKTEKGQGKTKRHWVRTGIIAVAVVAVIAMAWLCVTQKNNLKALYLAITSNAQTLEQKQEEQDKKQEDLLGQYGLVKPDTSQLQGPEETGAVTDHSPAAPAQPEGSLPTESDPAAGQNTQPSQTTDQPPAATPSGTPDQETDQLQEQLQGYINQLYQVQDRYQQFLNDMVESTKKEFWSLPKDQQVQENKLEIVQSKVNDLIEQENACDAEVDAILDNIQSVLEQQGRSTDLVNEIRTYYEETKANWKAAKMTELYS